MKKKIIILAAFVITFFTACTSTHMITFSNAELSDKEKDMIENNSNYSTASIAVSYTHLTLPTILLV